MNKKLHRLLLLATCGVPVLCTAQIKNPEFCPPSAASLIKIADFPVNTNNGMPAIGIPLHELSSGPLKFPLALDFNIDSYIQPNQLPDSPGAGWSLSSDIQIVRSINGQDDFGTWGYYSNRHIPAGYRETAVNRNQEYLAAFYTENYDEEPDKFYYRLLNKVGTFYFRRNADSTMTAVPVPANGVKIDFTRTEHTTSFRITDTDGTVYYFPDTNSDYEVRSAGEYTPPLSWKCESICNASRTDSICFEYTRINKYSAIGYTPTGIDLYDSYSGTAVPAGPSFSDNSVFPPAQPLFLNCLYAPQSPPGSLDSTAYYPPGSLLGPPLYLTANPKYSYNTQNPLTGSGSSRLYVYDCSRYDAFFEYVHPQPQNATITKNLYLHYPSRIRLRSGSVHFEYDTQEQGILQNITIEAPDGNTVKTIRFTQSYEYDPDLTQEESRYRKYDRRLMTLTVNGEKYDFSYSQNHVGGIVSDFWGYAYGIDYSWSSLLTDCFVPQHTVTLALGAAANFARFPDNVHNATIGDPMPADITPSTDPFLSIRYPTGGCVKFHTERHRYRDTDGTLHPIGGLRISRIDYYDEGGNTPVRQKIYKYGPHENGCGIVKQNLSFDETTGNCFTTQRLAYYYRPDGQSPNTCLEIASERKRTFLPYPVFSGDCGVGNWVCYSEVAAYDTEGGLISGKTVYKYDVSTLQGKVKMAEPRVAFPLDAHMWDVGVLDSVIEYKYISPGLFRLARITAYEHRQHTEPETVYKGRIWPSELAVPVNFGSTGDIPTDLTSFHKSHSSFIYNYLGMRVGCVQITSKTERIFEDDGSVRTQVTDYFYDNAACYFRPSRIRLRTWDGETTVQHRLFATDYPAQNAGDTLAAMSLKNVIDKPVEEFVVRNGKIVSADLYLYDTDGDIVRSYRLREPEMPAAQFRASNQPSAGTFTAAMTAFNPGYADYSLRAEVDYNAAKRPVEIREKGQKPLCYVWAYDNCHPVAEVQNACAQQIAPLAQSLAEYPSRDELLQFFGQLRNALPDAMVSGYTYKLLIGINSATSPSGRTTYYEYDADNRLSVIRDQTGNPVQRFEYQIIHKE